MATSFPQARRTFGVEASEKERCLQTAFLFLQCEMAPLCPWVPLASYSGIIRSRTHARPASSPDHASVCVSMSWH